MRLASGAEMAGDSQDKIAPAGDVHFNGVEKMKMTMQKVKLVFGIPLRLRGSKCPVAARFYAIEEER
jgi:hypothetical protein